MTATGVRVGHCHFDRTAAGPEVTLAPSRKCTSDATAMGGALSSDTQVSWPEVPGAARYKVYWRRADARDWDKVKDKLHLLER